MDLAPELSSKLKLKAEGGASHSRIKLKAQLKVHRQASRLRLKHKV